MMHNDNQWLPHINPKAITGFNETYFITLEAWRRGLEVIFKGSGKHYEIKSSKNIVYFRSALVKVKPEVDPVKITFNKALSKEYFEKLSVPFPEGKSFQANIDNKEIINYGKQIGFPVVLKPNKGTLGFGVIVNIMDEDSLKKEVSYLRDELGVSNLLLEKYITGEDYRVQVVGSKVVGAVKRVPANIIGKNLPH